MSLSQEKLLEEKCRLQSAQLAYLSEICQTLNSESEITHALQKLLLVLPAELNTSKTAVFVKESDDSIVLVSNAGFEDDRLPLLQEFFNHKSILHEVISQRKVMNIPSHELIHDVNEVVTKAAGIASGLLVPLLSSTECMGVLFIGSHEVAFIDPELAHFVQTVGIQIGQSIALSTVFNKMKFSEMRYRKLLEHASCSIFVADMQGTIVETNKQGEKLLGCSKSEIIGTRFKEYFAPEFKNQLIEWTKALSFGENLEHTEIQIVRKNGEVRLVDGSGVLVQVGRDTLIFMIGTDVTEVNQLRAQALLQDKLATIGLLAAGVAHEINNPIACVLSNLDFLNEKISEIEKNREMNFERNVDELKQVIKESIQAGLRVKNIVIDLKSYSRKDDGECEEIDIEELLDSAINMALSEYKTRGVVEKSYASDIPPLKVNGGKLHQVFLNIIVNAAQAIEEGHSEKNKIKIATMLQDEKVIIKIEDTGKGIPQEILVRIFDPFFTTKPVGEGTGLGLFICHEIIKKMGGVIRVESKADQGSTFLIELPVRESALMTAVNVSNG